MAYNSDDHTPGPPAQEGAAKDSGSTAAATETQPSRALVRFRSCRWQQRAEDGGAEYCTHREVKPYAGTTGFDPDAWCPDCQYYKLRRSPKKKPADEEYTY